MFFVATTMSKSELTDKPIKKEPETPEDMQEEVPEGTQEEAPEGMQEEAKEEETPKPTPTRTQMAHRGKPFHPSSQSRESGKYVCDQTGSKPIRIPENRTSDVKAKFVYFKPNQMGSKPIKFVCVGAISVYKPDQTGSKPISTL